MAQLLLLPSALLESVLLFPSWKSTHSWLFVEFSQLGMTLWGWGLEVVVVV